MTLPVVPPIAPMLARAVDELPRGDMRYEPKWDGFRTIVFCDDGDIELGSRNSRPMTRYFPELVEALGRALPRRCVVDGEIILPIDGRLDFDALSQRIHPAESRVRRLAQETPASFVAFDLLALDDRSLVEEPFGERRTLLERALAGVAPPVHLTPSTTDPDLAETWFDRFEGAGLDGVIAKPVQLPYLPGKRVQFKWKHRRTADCVVAGFRWHKDGEGVGSLLLGLWGDDGSLHHMGVASSFTRARRAELADELADLREGALEDHPWRSWADAEARAAAAGRSPGTPSRWNAGKDLSWEPVRPERVVEVAYERVDSGRFRHSARMLRWRPDRTPGSCTFGQLEHVDPLDLAEVFAG